MSRIVPWVVFAKPILICGSHARADRFDTTDGWRIEEHDYGVTLSREANDPQNIPEVQAFCVCGIGYQVPAPTPVGVQASDDDENGKHEINTRADDASTQIGMTQQSTPSPGIVKRGPGRPRKVPLT